MNHALLFLLFISLYDFLKFKTIAIGKNDVLDFELAEDKRFTNFIDVLISAGFDVLVGEDGGGIDLFFISIIIDGSQDEDEVIVHLLFEVTDKERELNLTKINFSLLISVSLEVDVHWIFCLIKNLES